MTSVLYPRLIDGAARELHQQYTHADLDQLQDRAAFAHRSAVFAATGGRRVTEDELRDLRNRIVKAAENAGFPGEGRRADRASFDLEVAQLLHERSGLVAAEASVRSIWAFLALVLLPDISYWRYPSPPPDRVIGTDITRHVWGRLWWRAHLLALPQQVERYRLLDVFGEAAFDQIFARRKSLGGSRALVRTLAEVWPSTDRGGVNDRQLLRDVLKRLLRTSVVIEFEALDEDELRRQVSEAAAETVAILSEDGSLSESHRARID
ncbi:MULTISPECIES: DUF6339 family protein [Rhodococcus]|uniref:DUF6339 family protein n=1 Tax=Rhodococcus TaxID=1827 RepID=UPI001E376A56|nr:DUF6339 family protein [Rhodococcus pyridinivorans]MCD2116728.1 DUF6339 family protein [Rhodococcus pyridinivorans]MCZ4625328.1 DUF6339 family protein [Rhodococcus pyridinivorans]MCZ4646538.1 DUF6339 family protein [Rhodococcus pyridinivorans]MDJ0482376.1 DUF6339 family protein [Rhodococcus pyridinivorans]